MRKIIVLFFLMVLSTTSLRADELLDNVQPEDQLGPNHQWIEKVAGTFGIPSSSDTTSTLTPAFGGEIAFGYRFEPHLSISIASGYYQYGLQNLPTGNIGGCFSYVPLETVINYNFGNGSFRPYVSFGIGVAFNTYSLTRVIQGSSLQANVWDTSFIMSPAIGFLKILNPKTAIFLEARADMNFRSNGGSIGMANGSPSVFIPIQLGLTFFII